jgi:uncharacterized protein YqeY
MNLKERIHADYLAAFKNKETERKTLLGVIKGEIQNEETRKGKMNDDAVLNVLKKMEKSLKITNTPESLRELSYIEGYLPTLMTREQIYTIVKGYQEAGMNNVGQMMGSFNKEHKGLADNTLVKEVIESILK